MRTWNLIECIPEIRKYSSPTSDYRVILGLLYNQPDCGAFQVIESINTFLTISVLRSKINFNGRVLIVDTGISILLDAK